MAEFSPHVTHSESADAVYVALAEGAVARTKTLDDRRLVDVANDCIITSEDCGTRNGITVQAEIDGGQVVSSLPERILGRTTVEDVKNPETGEVILRRGREIGEDLAEKIEAAHIQKVRVRSVLTCSVPSASYTSPSWAAVAPGRPWPSRSAASACGTCTS